MTGASPCLGWIGGLCGRQYSVQLSTAHTCGPPAVFHPGTVLCSVDAEVNEMWSPSLRCLQSRGELRRELQRQGALGVLQRDPVQADGCQEAGRN